MLLVILGFDSIATPTPYKTIIGLRRALRSEGLIVADRLCSCHSYWDRGAILQGRHYHCPSL